MLTLCSAAFDALLLIFNFLLGTVIDRKVYTKYIADSTLLQQCIPTFQHKCIKYSKWKMVSKQWQITITTTTCRQNKQAREFERHRKYIYVLVCTTI